MGVAILRYVVAPSRMSPAIDILNILACVCSSVEKFILPDFSYHLVRMRSVATTGVSGDEPVRLPGGDLRGLGRFLFHQRQEILPALARLGREGGVQHGERCHAVETKVAECQAQLAPRGQKPSVANEGER